MLDRPRPFVFRAAHLDGSSIASGERFHFDLHLFDRSPEVYGQFLEAFQQIARDGMGPRRARAELLEAKSEPLEFALPEEPVRANRIAIRFVTPTELKDGGRIIERPNFAVLFGRVRDRVSSLRSFYGPGPLDLDFRAMGERASLIEMPRCDIRHVDVKRRSSRTGQIHSIGGVVGDAEYEGDLGEFIPILEVAQFTGVGRQTVWGKGQIEIRL